MIKQNSSNFKKLSITFLTLTALFLNIYYLILVGSQLKPWEDEIVSLSSNLSFIKELNHNSFPYFPLFEKKNIDSFSPYNSIGPLSSIGSVLWLLVDSNNNLLFARIANIFYNLFLVFIIFKTCKVNLRISNLIYLSFLTLLLIPWWYGALYSLGTISGMLIFTICALNFENNYYLSIFFLGTLIFFSKFYLIIPIFSFLIFYFILNKTSIKKLFYGIILFSIPSVAWYLIIMYKEGVNYIYRYNNALLDLLLNQPGSGTKSALQIKSFSFFDTIINSEIYQWNSITKIRILLVPLCFIFLMKFLKFKNIPEKIFLSIFFSIIISYFWFLIFSETKWIRYSQIFIIPILILIILKVTEDTVYRSRNILFIFWLMLGLFMNNFLSLIFFIFLISLNYAFNFKLNHLIFFLYLIFTVNLFLEINNFSIIDINYYNLNYCEPTFNTEKCMSQYFNLKLPEFNF